MKINNQQNYFYEGSTLSYEFRINALKKIKKQLLIFEKEIIGALKKDLNKTEFESYQSEFGYVMYALNHTLKRLRSWMKPTKVKTPLFHFYSHSKIEKVPLGRVLIVGPYNYPFQLVIVPLIGAIAAGNVITIKPSELAKNTGIIIKKIIEESFDPKYIKVEIGGPETFNKILESKIDHIFFTGSTKVGHIIYKKAAENLIPVTLELGGKSPVIVDETANIDVSIKRILRGKLLNSGQTCVSPDYVFVSKKIIDKFYKRLKEIYSTKFKNQISSKIINKDKEKRLSELVKDSKFLIDGKKNNDNAGLQVIIDASENDRLMNEEIFGPILPVSSFESLEDVVEYLSKKSKPLAFYIFSENKKNIKYVMSKLSFGGAAINNTLLQITNLDLPFGGVGESGIGRYNGKYSFNTFSHLRAVMHSSSKIDISVYPPYNKKKINLLKKLFK